LTNQTKGEIPHDNDKKHFDSAIQETLGEFVKQMKPIVAVVPAGDKAGTDLELPPQSTATTWTELWSPKILSRNFRHPFLSKEAVPTHIRDAFECPGQVS
jgi:hypothetical protein